MLKTLTLSLAAAATFAVGGVAFAQADPNADRGPGATRAEVEQRTAQAFGRMDANGDGVLNQADREARQKEAFERVDADSNGAISLAEFTARGEDRREARAERGGPGERRMGGRGMRGMRGMRGPGMAPRVGDAADDNGDGAISQAEFASAALARFDRVDADKDGTISREERRAARQQMRGARRDRRDG